MSITNLVQNLAQNNNSSYKDFAAEQTQRQFVKELSQNSFFESYRALFYTALLFSFLAQVASAISSYSFFAALLQVKILNPYLLVSAVIGILLSVEIIKYTVVNKSFKELFALQPQHNTALFLLAFLVSSLSIYASITGGGNLGIDTTQPQLVSNEFDKEIAALRNDITGIQARNTWKGQTYLPTKEKSLLYAKETEIAALKAKKESALQAVTAQNETNKTQFQIGFAAFELLFFVCTIFVWYYKRRSSVEFLAVTPDTIGTATVQLTTKTQTVIAPPPSTENLDTPPAPAPSKRIGFVFGKSKGVPNENSNTVSDTPNENSNRLYENRVCLHCQQTFIHNHRKQKYCCNVCRITAWEQRNGKRLKKRKVTQSTKTNSLF
jgi:hypothetical protein